MVNAATPSVLAQAIAIADQAHDGRRVAELAHDLVTSDFRARQLQSLVGAPAEELKEKTGKRAARVGKALQRGAEHILRAVYGVDSINALRAMPARELLVRALTHSYQALGGADVYEYRFVDVVRMSDERFFAVFEKRTAGSKVAKPLPGLVTPVAMTLVCDGADWYSYLDGALRIDALRVKAPDDYTVLAW